MIVFWMGCGVDQTEIDSEAWDEANMANALDQGPDSAVWTSKTLVCDDDDYRYLHLGQSQAGATMDRVWSYRGKAGAANFISFTPTSFSHRGAYIRLYDAETQTPLATGHCKPTTTDVTAREEAYLERCIGDYEQNPQGAVRCDAERQRILLSFWIDDKRSDKFLLQIGPVCKEPLDPKGSVRAPEYELGAYCAEEEDDELISDPSPSLVLD
jgi:hypothetical protein